jgi:hypothetical protein
LAVARRPAARRSKPVAGRGHRLSVSRPRRRPQLSSGSATPSGTPRLLMSDEGFLSVDMHVCPGSPVFSNFLPTQLRTGNCELATRVCTYVGFYRDHNENWAPRARWHHDGMSG